MEGGRRLREMASLYIYGRKPELWGCINRREKLGLVKQRSGWLGRSDNPHLLLYEDTVFIDREMQP